MRRVMACWTAAVGCGLALVASAGGAQDLSRAVFVGADNASGTSAAQQLELRARNGDVRVVVTQRGSAPVRSRVTLRTLSGQSGGPDFSRIPFMFRGPMSDALTVDTLRLLGPRFRVLGMPAGSSAAVSVAAANDPRSLGGMPVLISQIDPSRCWCEPRGEALARICQSWEYAEATIDAVAHTIGATDVQPRDGGWMQFGVVTAR